MRAQIKSLYGRRIWDSRGRPTIEVEATLANDVVGYGVAPAGASRGTAEATDLRDGGPRFDGFDVQMALAAVRSVIAPALIDQDASNQERIDAILVALDPTVAKERVGGNACIAASMAVLNAAANCAGEPLWHYLAQSRPVNLPLPEIQIFGGGAHAGGRIDVQDLLVMPVGADSFPRSLEMVAEVYIAAGKIMEERGSRAGVADEGGWWPCFDSNEDAIETLLQSIERAHLKPGNDVVISLDIAASELYREGKYILGLDKQKFSGPEWAGVLEEWLKKYPIVSIEDPFAEGDKANLAAFTAKFGSTVQIVGDDNLATNARLIQTAAAEGCCNAVLLKPNQVGTITETRRALEAARTHNWGCIISARSGETEDATITHLATGWNTGQLKVGSFARSERMAKWNAGLRISDNKRFPVGYAGANALLCDWRRGPWNS